MNFPLAGLCQFEPFHWIAALTLMSMFLRQIIETSFHVPLELTEVVFSTAFSHVFQLFHCIAARNIEISHPLHTTCLNLWLLQFPVVFREKLKQHEREIRDGYKKVSPQNFLRALCREAKGWRGRIKKKSVQWVKVSSNNRVHPSTPCCAWRNSACLLAAWVKSWNLSSLDDMKSFKLLSAHNFLPFASYLFRHSRFDVEQRPVLGNLFLLRPSFHYMVGKVSEFRASIYVNFRQRFATSAILWKVRNYKLHR